RQNILCGRLDSKLVEKKTKHVGLFGDALFESSANPVAGAGGAAEEDRGIRCGGHLQPGRHLAGLGGVDAAVVFAGGQQDGWVLHAIADMMVGRISVEGFELIGVLYRAEFSNVELT